MEDDADTIPIYTNYHKHSSMTNNPTESTTRDDTTIDAVSLRYLEKITSQTYVSYFSYHRPIISMIEYEQ